MNSDRWLVFLYGVRYAEDHNKAMWIKANSAGDVKNAFGFLEFCDVFTEEDLRIRKVLDAVE
jgi:hypothetical protein